MLNQTKRFLRFALLFFTATVPTFSTSFGFEPTSDEETRLILKRLNPRPVSSVFGAESVVLDENLSATLATGDPETAAPLFESFFQQWFGHKPKLTVQKSNEKFPSDGYRLLAENGALTVVSSDVSGAINALKTLRQLAEPNRDSSTLTAYRVPETEISDAPALAFRGLHLCWFPETDPTLIERGIRMAAYYKLNYVVIETWGTFRFESHPEFCREEFACGKDEIRRLNRIAKEQGVALIPQFNLFGHASSSRSVSGKHTILDFHPELAPIFEPDGWTFCLANPGTRQLLTDLVLELYDAYEAPPFFHFGCDEAYSAGTCSACRKTDYGALLLDHLTYFGELLEQRNCRPMIWHDMLIPSGGEFAGYVANGKPSTVAVLEKLSKNFVICDWQYSRPKENETWPTTTYFQEKGFDVVPCPWNYRDGILSLGATACEKNLFGLLTTTWHHFDGGEMRTILIGGSEAAWGTPPSLGGAEEFDVHLRQIGWDMKERIGYRQTGVVPWQLEPEPVGGR